MEKYSISSQKILPNLLQIVLKIANKKYRTNLPIAKNIHTPPFFHFRMKLNRKITKNGANRRTIYFFKEKKICCKTKKTFTQKSIVKSTSQ